MARRSLDGRYRNTNQPTSVPNSILIARWVEKEVLAAKLLGVSTFASIAAHIVAVARGNQIAMTSLPPGIVFPGNYNITAAGCHKALNRALNREPRVAAEQLAQIILQRSDELFLALQPAIRRQETKAIQTAARVLDLQARIGGTKSGGFTTPAVPQPEPKEEGTSPAVIDLFKSAVEYLLGLGEQLDGYQIIRLETTPKAIETTARKDVGTETEQALLENKENKVLVQKKQ